jgi:hypothetical protein
MSQLPPPAEQGPPHRLTAALAAAAAVLQYLLAWWKPFEPLIWLPTVAAVVFALVYAYLTVSRLQRLASFLIICAASLVATPNIAAHFQWRDAASAKLIIDNSPFGALALLAVGCFLLALDFDQRERRLGKTVVLASTALLLVLTLMAPSGRRTGTATSQLQTAARDILVADSPAAIVNSNVYGDVSVEIARSKHHVELDPLKAAPISYRDVSAVLSELQKKNRWDATRLGSELISVPDVPKERVSLRIRNLTGTSLWLTLVDVTSCVDKTGHLNQSDAPLDHNVLRGADAWANMVTVLVDPDDANSGRLNLVTYEFDQFHAPSGWFVAFVDYEDPRGRELLRTPIGAFNFFRATEPVLRIVPREAAAGRSPFAAELEQ